MQHAIHASDVASHPAQTASAFPGDDAEAQQNGRHTMLDGYHPKDARPPAYVKRSSRWHI